MSHPCPAAGCDVPDVPDDRLMCRQDWQRVGRPLQQAVYRAWDHGRGRGSRAHIAAMRAAIDAANRARGEQGRPSPHELWAQAGGDQGKYLDLMRQHGHLLSPGDEGYEEARANVPACGWRPGARPASADAQPSDQERNPS